MSLRPCPECKNPVSTDASACPQCGATLKKPTSIVTKIVAILIAFIVIRGIFSLQQTPPASPSQAPSSAPAAALPIENWHYTTAKDDMTGKEINYAEAVSLNKEDLHFPYGPGIDATLTLRKHPRYG